MRSTESMNDYKSLSRYVPEALAVAAGVLTVIAILPVSGSLRTALFAAALALAIVGWLWTMREQRRLKDIEAARADRLAEEKARLEPLLARPLNTHRPPRGQPHPALSLRHSAR